MSLFGDNNRAKIDMQILIAEEDLSEDQVYDQFGEYEDDNPDPINYEEIADGLEMRQWLDGEREESPSSNWVDLLEVSIL